MSEKELLNRERIAILKENVVTDGPKIPNQFYTLCTFYKKPNRKLEYMNLPLIGILDMVFKRVLMIKYPDINFSSHGYLREDIMKNFDKIKNEDKELIELYYQISSLIESASDCTKNRNFDITAGLESENYDNIMFGSGIIDEKICNILEKESKKIYDKIQKINRYKRVHDYSKIFSKTIIFKVYKYISDLISSLSAVVDRNRGLIIISETDSEQIMYFCREFSLISLYLIKTQYRNIMYRLINKYCSGSDSISIDNLLNFVFPEIIIDSEIDYQINGTDKHVPTEYDILYRLLDIKNANFYNEYRGNIRQL